MVTICTANHVSYLIINFDILLNNSYSSATPPLREHFHDPDTFFQITRQFEAISLISRQYDIERMLTYINLIFGIDQTYFNTENVHFALEEKDYLVFIK